MHGDCELFSTGTIGIHASMKKRFIIPVLYYIRGHNYDSVQMVPEPLCRLQCKISHESLPFPILLSLLFILVVYNYIDL